MKKNLFSFIVLLSSSALFSQEITTSKDSLFFEGPNAATADDFADIYGEFIFKNVTAASDSFRWRRIYNNLPANWASAVCDINLCHSETTDSADFEMAIGDSGIFYAHFYPGTAGGFGEMVIEIFNITDPSQKIEVYAKATAWNIFASFTPPYQETIQLWPNPVNDGVFYLDNKVQSIVVLDLNGREILRATNQHRIDISSIPNGIYITKLLDTEGSIKTQKLIKN